MVRTRDLTETCCSISKLLAGMPEPRESGKDEVAELMIMKLPRVVIIGPGGAFIVGSGKTLWGAYLKRLNRSKPSPTGGLIREG